MKRFIIWIAAMLAVILLADAAGGTVNYLAVGKRLRDSMTGYSRKMLLPLEEPHSEQEEARNSGILLVRAAVSDGRLENLPGFLYNFLFLNTVVDSTTVFLNENGRHAFSSGIFANVYHDDGEKRAFIRQNFGLVNVYSLVRQQGADELFSALEHAPDAKVRLDAYTVTDGFEITPVQVTLIDSFGNTLQTVTLTADGDAVQEDHCYLRNDFSPEYDLESLYRKMQTARYGGLRSDRAAEQYAAQAPLNQSGYEKDRIIPGIASLTLVHTEVTDGIAMVNVQYLDYSRGVIFYTVLLGTAVTLLVWLVKRRHTGDEG